MAISQNTLDIINASKDIDIEFNTKLIILFTILAYCVLLWVFSFKMDVNKAWKLITRNIFMRAMTLPYVFFFPLFLGLLYRGVQLESLYMWMLSIYTILFVAFQVLFFLFGAEWIVSFFGIQDLGKLLQSKNFKRRGKDDE